MNMLGPHERRFLMIEITSISGANLHKDKLWSNLFKIKRYKILFLTLITRKYILKSVLSN